MKVKYQIRKIDGAIMSRHTTIDNTQAAVLRLLRKNAAEVEQAKRLYGADLYTVEQIGD